MSADRIVPSVSEASGIMDFEGSRPSRDSSSIKSEDVVMSISSDFIVVNKPHDVRMDGAFDLTLQKLLLKWIPGASLDSLKWVHQLDFATSGVLTVARNREAANLASRAFEYRETSKEYLAVVEGHVNANGWPVAQAQEAEENDATELDLKRKSKPKVTQRETDIRENNTRLYYQAMQDALRDDKVEGEQRVLLEELVSRPQKDYIRNPKLRKKLRKAVRFGPHLQALLALDGNEIIRETSAIEKEPPTPIAAASDPAPSSSFAGSIVQIRTAAPGSFMAEERDEQVAGLRVDLPIAEMPGDFRMRLGDESSPGRPCRTTIVVLSYHFYQGRPVTRLLLRPRSGRRHQLRLHCQAIGHSIVGDVTYGLEVAGKAERMMLHAHRLHIPHSRELLKSGQIGGTLVKATAPDPFESLLSAPVRVMHAKAFQPAVIAQPQTVPLSDLRIAIVGGGLAGLAVALSCQQAGITNVTVYERDVRFDDRRQGYGLTLTNNPKGPLAKLGVLGECVARDCPSRSHWIFTPSGDIKGYFGRAFDDQEVDRTKSTGGNLRVPRQDLRQMLMNKLRPGTVVWGQRLVDYVEGEHEVQATFTSTENGEGERNGESGSGNSVVRCDVLVGADGIRSRVRALRDHKLFGHLTQEERDKEGLSSPTPLSYLGVSVIIGLSTATHPLLTDQGFYVLDGQHRLFTMPFRRGTATQAPLHMWQLSFSGWTEEHCRSFLAAQPGDEDDPTKDGHKGLTSPGLGRRLLAEAQRRTADWMNPVAALVQATMPEDVWGTPLYDRNPMWLLDGANQPKTTVDGDNLLGSRVTLVGDACHPMSMFKGQGANQAMEDGPLFAEWLHGGPSAGKATLQLTRKTLLTRLRSFERQMVARSSIKQRDSRIAAHTLHSVPVQGPDTDERAKNERKWGEFAAGLGFGFEGLTKEYRKRRRGRGKKAGDNTAITASPTEGGEAERVTADEVVQRLFDLLEERGVGAKDADRIEESVSICVDEVRTQLGRVHSL